MAEEEKGQAFQPINIREVVAGKNKKLARRLPGFVYRWLERILHLEEMNEFLRQFGHLKKLEFTNEVIRYLNIQFKIEGFDQLPENGRFMFVSNHPLGGLDGVLLLKLLNEKFGTTRSLTNDFLMALTPLNDWFVPINKVGGQGREALKAIEDLYESDDQIMIFPAGLCSRKINGKIVDLEWQKHFIQKAVQHKIDVVPIYFAGRNSNFFYQLANFRKLFKIKFNIEMMYLVDELYKHKNKKFMIRFGEPIPYQTFDRSRKPIEWAAYVKDKVYFMGKTI
ncbi:MAG: 1-acyl-sn-glycerol-3-phosphate acyltransferase [Prolixibacteraceae bacterium]|nr:1-acyl-sn-glycerol-3-phosphate acyltransferase [Prolixibacteraceae bacterium]